jgi:peptide/nickel transport system permease protein
MTRYIVLRLLMGLIIIFLVTLIVFFTVRLMPGDPLVIYMGQQASSGTMTPEQLDFMRHQFGLDKPIMVQYFSWMNGIIHGNLGTSINYHQSVGSLMRDRFPITLYMGLTAFIIANIIGILLGVLAAIRRSTWVDTVVTTFSNLGITIPIFWLGLLMMYIFGLKLGWLPIGGYTSPFTDFWYSTKQLIMPVACLAVTSLAGTARQMRSSMLEVIRQDYIRTAWSKGLRERIIILKHAMKISLIPVITLMGLGLGMVIGGSVLVETVFAIPGIGRLLTTSIFNQDYTVIQSSTLVISVLIIFINLIVDISYGWFDPRIRYG